MKLYIGKVEGDSDWKVNFKKQMNGHQCELIENESQKEGCDYFLHVISPLTEAVKTVINAVNDSNFYPRKTVFCVIAEDNGKEFNEHALKSLFTYFDAFPAELLTASAREANIVAVVVCLRLDIGSRDLALGVDIIYETTVVGLLSDSSGTIEGVEVRAGDGRHHQRRDGDPGSTCS